MDLTSREYSYKGLRFRAYCDRNGKNGRLVLEDIVGILLELANDTREPSAVTREQLQQINIETTVYDGVHLVTADSMLDFYLGSDNLSNVNNATEFEEFAHLLADRMTEILEKDLVILGKTAFLIPEWRKAAIQITNEYWNEVVNESGKISFKTWLEHTYKLELVFLVNWIVNKYRNVISATFRTTSGARPEKDNSSNLYEPHEFAIIEPLITNYLSNTDEEWSNDINNKVFDHNQTRNFNDYKQKIAQHKAQGYSTKDIIQELFNAAPDSHIVKKYGRNYFYESLELLVHHVSKRK